MQEEGKEKMNEIGYNLTVNTPEPDPQLHRRRSSLLDGLASARRRLSGMLSVPPISQALLRPYSSGEESAASGSDFDGYCSSDGGRAASPAVLPRAGEVRRRTRSARSNEFSPNTLLWAALRKGKMRRVYRILLDEWRKASSDDEDGGHDEPDGVPVPAKTQQAPELDVSIANSEGITPLHLCVFAGNPRCVRLLLALGANPSAGDNDNWTPLHAAASKGHTDIIVMLAVAGAALRVKDKRGRRPHDVAASDDVKDVLKNLRKLDKASKLVVTN